MNCKGIEMFLELSPKTKYWSLAQVWNREEKVCCSVCFSQILAAADQSWRSMWISHEGSVQNT